QVGPGVEEGVAGAVAGLAELTGEGAGRGEEDEVGGGQLAADLADGERATDLRRELLLQRLACPQLDEAAPGHARGMDHAVETSEALHRAAGDRAQSAGIRHVRRLYDYLVAQLPHVADAGGPAGGSANGRAGGEQEAAV